MAKFTRAFRGGYVLGGWKILPDDAPPNPARYRRALRWRIGREDDPTTGPAWVVHTTDTLREARAWVEDQLSPHPGDIPLQLYGHPVDVPEDIALVLCEATICSTSSGIRKLAQHLLLAADEMDRLGDGFSHMHFNSSASKRPEIVIGRYSPDHDRPIVWDKELEGFKRT